MITGYFSVFIIKHLNDLTNDIFIFNIGII